VAVSSLQVQWFASSGKGKAGQSENGKNPEDFVFHVFSVNERAIVDLRQDATEIGVEHIIGLSKIQVIKNDYREISRTRIDLVRAFESLLEKYYQVNRVVPG
jgi:hypothetical protein